MCEVDWHEHERLLKVAFPLDLHTDEITREIQFGHLRSAIHTNTSWDSARFEVCAHRWVDVAEPGYGVALLNDGKYGHDATRERVQAPGGGEVPITVLRLSLLRGARYPDPEADQGRHRFTYSLLPHAGDFRSGGVVAEGYQLNAPVRIVEPVGPLGPGAALSTVTAGHPAVVIEAVKLADDGSGDLIVRCYEAWGGRVTTDLRFGVAVVSARSVDTLERDMGSTDLAVVDDSVTFSLRPFQILTLRVTRNVQPRPGA